MSDTILSTLLEVALMGLLIAGAFALTAGPFAVR